MENLREPLYLNGFPPVNANSHWNTATGIVKSPVLPHSLTPLGGQFVLMADKEYIGMYMARETISSSLIAVVGGPWGYPIEA